MAMGVEHSLCCMMAAECMPMFSSDGLRLYFYTLTTHFGEWVRGRRRPAVDLAGIERAAVRAGEEDTAQTAIGSGGTQYDVGRDGEAEGAVARDGFIGAHQHGFC